MKKRLTKKIPTGVSWGIIVFLSVFVLWTVLYYGYKDTPYEKKAGTNIALPLEASLTLNYGGGEQRIFAGDIVEGMTVYDALVQSAAAGKLEVKTKMVDTGIVVESIDGVTNKKNGPKWHLYINGSFKNLDSPLKYQLSGGEKIEFRYE